MRLPLALGELHIGKNSLKGGILGAACVYAKGDLVTYIPHMANAYLRKAYAVGRAFNAEIILSAAKAVPHTPYGRRDLAGCPIGMLMYGKEASNRKQEIDRQHYTIPNQRPKDKHFEKI